MTLDKTLITLPLAKLRTWSLHLMISLMNLSSAAIQRKRLEEALTSFPKSFYTFSFCLDKEVKIGWLKITHDNTLPGYTFLSSYCHLGPFTTKSIWSHMSAHKYYILHVPQIYQRLFWPKSSLGIHFSILKFSSSSFLPNQMLSKNYFLCKVMPVCPCSKRPLTSSECKLHRNINPESIKVGMEFIWSTFLILFVKNLTHQNVSSLPEVTQI